MAQYDRDITPHPSDQLKAATALLQQAQAEAAQPKSDWMGVVAKARSATTPQESGPGRGPHPARALDARRLKLATTLQQAQASVSRASNFASAHPADIPQDALDAIAGAARQLTQGSTMASALEIWQARRCCPRLGKTPSLSSRRPRALPIKPIQTPSPNSTALKACASRWTPLCVTPATG